MLLQLALQDIGQLTDIERRLDSPLMTDLDEQGRPERLPLAGDPAETEADAPEAPGQHLVPVHAPRGYQVRRSLLAALAIAVLISVIVLSDAAGPLTEAEVISNAAVMMFGGIETTEGMIANALLRLLSSPAQLELVLAGRGLVPAAIEESLRLAAGCA